MHVPESYQFFCPVKVNSGSKALEQLPSELGALGVERPLILGRRDALRRGALGTIITAFKESGMAVGLLDAVPADFDVTVVRQLANVYRSKRHDAVITVGGGSIIDAAKVLNLCVSEDVEDVMPYTREGVLKTRLKPFVFVPTMTGTGYETSKYAWMKNLTLSSHFLMPDLVVIDPRMVRGGATVEGAALAMAALGGAADVCMCRVKNPLADTYAYAAIQYVSENMAGAMGRARDTMSRMAIVNAAVMAGCALSNVPPGPVRRLGTIAGDMFRIPDGICMGLLLPYILDYYTVHHGYFMADLLLPLAGFEEYACTAHGLRAQRAINRVYRIQHELFHITGGAIPRTLKEAQVPRYMLQDIAERAVMQGVPDIGYDECLTLLTHAWDSSPVAFDEKRG